MSPPSSRPPPSPSARSPIGCPAARRRPSRARDRSTSTESLWHLLRPPRLPAGAGGVLSAPATARLLLPGRTGSSCQAARNSRLLGSEGHGGAGLATGPQTPASARNGGGGDPERRSIGRSEAQHSLPAALKRADQYEQRKSDRAHRSEWLHLCRCASWKPDGIGRNCWPPQPQRQDGSGFEVLGRPLSTSEEPNSSLNCVTLSLR